MTTDPAPDDPKDRKALDRACRALAQRYTGVLILVTEGDGKGPNNQSAQAGNQNTIDGMIAKFAAWDNSFQEPSDDEEDEDDDEERWKREGGKGNGPEPA